MLKVQITIPLIVEIKLRSQKGHKEVLAMLFDYSGNHYTGVYLIIQYSLYILHTFLNAHLILKIVLYCRFPKTELYSNIHLPTQAEAVLNYQTQN